MNPDVGDGSGSLPDHEYYDRLRRRETSRLLEPLATITKRYSALTGRLCLVLGGIEPLNRQDSIIRDLMADAFDFMQESRTMLLGAKLVTAYPLARRALETISLLHLTSISEDWAARWDSGEQISNAMVRRELETLIPGGPSDELTEVYKFFSCATHPNRETVLERHLGSGNQYSLGVVAAPERILLYEFGIHHLSMWDWFATLLSYVYREQLTTGDPAFFEEYVSIDNEMPYVMAMLRADFRSLMVLRQGLDFTGS